MKFAEQVVAAHWESRSDGLLFDLAGLFLNVGRYIEAEHYLSCAYRMNPSNMDVLYSLNRVFCLRHSFFAANWAVEKMKDAKYGLLIETKAELMFLLMAGRYADCEKLCLSAFDDLKTDDEFLYLSYEASVRAQSADLAALTFAQPAAARFVERISKQNQARVKKLLVAQLISLAERVGNRA